MNQKVNNMRIIKRSFIFNNNTIIGKVCSFCKKSKPLTEYWKQSKTSNRIHSRCKECMKDEYYLWNHSLKGKVSRHLRNKRFYKKHHESCLDEHLRQKFGVPKGTYQRMIVKQKNRCAVCNKKESWNRRLSLDHNHKTNEVRGLLCHKCNSAIGFAQENTKILKLMIQYLQKYGK